MDAGTPRADCVARLAAWLAALECSHAVRVAIDGPDAAGKTTLADELAAGLAAAHAREAVRVSLDDFQHPAEQRHRRGRLSPEGYLYDSFDHAALRHAVLDPEAAPPGAILLVDGVFLQRPELTGCWDARVFVRVSEAESLLRALRRDATRFGSEAAVRERYGLRYLPAQRLYEERIRPAQQADVVVDNEDVWPSRDWSSARAATSPDAGCLSRGRGPWPAAGPSAPGS